MVTSKSQAEKEIKRLIEKYERVKAAREIKRYDEANTRKDFIMPLFKALGWDVYNDFVDREVIEEETAVKGRVDYSFRINNIPQFLLEAKALKVKLDKIEWAKQAVTYGWNKGIPWVVLTDFEGLKLFNSEWLVDSPQPNLEFTYNDFLKRLDDLLFLSKQSIEKGELDKQAEKWGIKAKRSKVTEKLATDLLKWRGWLYEVFRHYNKEETEEVINESVQRVLDRFIFIRVCEDRKLEPEILWEALRTWIAHNRKPDNFMKELRPVFKKFKDNYNSNLFEPHPCETLDCYGEPFEKIIEDLYSDKEKGVKYDFSAISVNVLGSIYEQYLGYIQEKGVVNGAKKKKQGIYYTPEFIVDYIVQNTLGVALKEKSLREIENVKVLDPACGSGSFLIKAFDLLNQKLTEEKAQEKSGQQAAFRKFNILRNDIYGVDLDSQAIEIARLNLLLKSLEPNHKLPMLSDKTKVGNSLIFGKGEELRKYFGEKWKEKNPFNWEEEFPEVIKEGGFDVIVGNPPYVSFYSRQSQATRETKNELDYLIQKYDFIQDKDKLGRFNTLMFFIERCIKLLRKDGYLGLIVDTNLHSNPSMDIRKYIIERTTMVKVVDEIKVFEGVASSQVILILKKAEPKADYDVTWQKFVDGNFKTMKILGQKYINDGNDFSFKIPQDQRAQEILEKMSRNPTLEQLVGRNHIRTSITFTGQKDKFVREDKKVEIDYPLLEGSNSLPHPYAPLKWESYIRYDIKLRDKLNNKYLEEAQRENRRSPKVIGLGNLNLFRSPKVFIRLSDDRITASYTDEFVCADLSLYILTLPNLEIVSKELHLLYLLGILNSKPVTFLVRKSNWIRNLNTGTPQIRLKDIRRIPIPKPKWSLQKKIAEKAEFVLELNREISKISENTEKWQKLIREMKRLKEQIDQLVYKLYDLTPGEIEIVEKG